MVVGNLPTPWEVINKEEGRLNVQGMILTQILTTLDGETTPISSGLTMIKLHNHHKVM
jgi:hypothetical protein